MSDQGSIFDRLVEIGRTDEQIAETYVEEDTVEMLVALARVARRRLGVLTKVADLVEVELDEAREAYYCTETLETILRLLGRSV